MVIFQCFSSHNPTKLRQTTMDWEWRRFYRSFINLTELRKGRVTCQRLIGDIKQAWKISFFSISDFAAFLRAGNPCRRHNKYFIYSCFEKSCGKKSVKKHAEISLVLFSFTSGFQRNLRKVIVGTRHRRLDEVIYLNC